MDQRIIGRAIPGGANQGRCTMCELRKQQADQANEALREANKKIGSLKEELTRVQASRTRQDSSRAQHEAEVVYRARKLRFMTHARVMLLFMRYIRVVLSMLKAIHDHPQGGVCMFCDGEDGKHEARCALERMLADPAKLVLEQADVEINEEALPIPGELRVDALKKLVDTPWELDKDPTRECSYRGCSSWVVPGHPYCAAHLPEQDGGDRRCVVIGCKRTPLRGGVRCETHS